MWIQVDATNTLGTAENVIECVASGARNHRNAIGRSDIQGQFIDMRVFPALVVDEISLVDLIEEPLFHAGSFLWIRFSIVKWV